MRLALALRILRHLLVRFGHYDCYFQTPQSNFRTAALCNNAPESPNVDASTLEPALLTREMSGKRYICETARMVAVLVMCMFEMAQYTVHRQKMNQTKNKEGGEPPQREMT